VRRARRVRLRAGGLLALAVLLAGSPAPRAQDRLFANDGPLPDTGFGFSVAGVEDIDADGVPDYIVGALACTSPNGKLARVFSGATGTLVREHLGDPTGCYGMSVAGLGDLDGDGVPDYGVGDVRVDSMLAPQAGRVFLYSGATGGIIRIHEGDTSAARFGMSLATAGDVDHDSVPDVFVGSGWDSTIGFEFGSADVYSGASGALLLHFDGDAERDWFGASCTALDDVDADGYTDLAVGAPIRWYGATGAEPAGYVRVFSGRTGLELATYHGVPPQDHYGISISGVADLDGDGVGELAIGAPRRKVDKPSGPVEVGMLEVLSGATGALLFRTYGTAQSKYGTAVNELGDLDGDGLQDLLVGACYCQNNVPLNGGKGWVEVRSGASGDLLAKLVDGETMESFAYAVAPLGDLTGDGVPDFVVGNTFDATLGAKTGSAWVYSGADLTLLLDAHELSLQQGGAQTLQLDAGPEHAATDYLLLGCISGTSPGFRLGGQHVALNLDVYSSVLLASPSNALYGSMLGTLDEAGRAQVVLTIPPGLVPASAAGLVLHHAYVLHAPGGYVLASNPLPLTLQP
jgi:hypothetical protein